MKRNNTRKARADTLMVFENCDSAPDIAGSSAQSVGWLLTKMLESDLNALIEKLLIFPTELIAAIGAAMEELRHCPDRRMRLALDLCGAAHIGHAVEIVIDDIVVDLTHHYAYRRLAADA